MAGSKPVKRGKDMKKRPKSVERSPKVRAKAPAPVAHSPEVAEAEVRRLAEDSGRKANWKRWGPYLSERQWGTVREDYSGGFESWNYFDHDQARSRAYRWGEDGLLGFTDRECRLCFALALWNGKDPILKERLFGLTNPQGNHGEDVKENYYYIDSTPTHSYFKGLYKYPHAEYPYAELIRRNAERGKGDVEFELADTGVFEEHRYFDVLAEYAKGGPDDVLIRITVTNRGPEAATIHVLPTLWFRNTWVWGCAHEGCTLKPRIMKTGDLTVLCEHETLQPLSFEFGSGPGGGGERHAHLMFTDNHTNNQRLWGAENLTKYVKDGFHRRVIHNQMDAVNTERGTKVTAWYEKQLAPGESLEIRARLTERADKGGKGGGRSDKSEGLKGGFDRVFEQRIAEADAFYDRRLPGRMTAEQKRVARQACAGLLWSKQFYHYIVEDWLRGDPSMPAPPPSRIRRVPNSEWEHLYSRDVLSMPDKWEYPWFAAWDLAFHMLPMSRLDPAFAKSQLLLLLREWYMHPNGQLPAYEYNFSDVNPPVHAWACWRVYKMTAPRGQRDVKFLARCFQKLMLNFTWWVNRKDPSGRNIFSGGFLGLDNIGVFDRSAPPPGGGHLEQADGTAWMAFYCATMMMIAMELALHDNAYEDIASKFFEHFVQIVDAMNTLGGTGLWDDRDGFYYDQLMLDTGPRRRVPLRVRSLVGLLPLCTAHVLEAEELDRLPGFRKRTAWFLKYRDDLARHITYLEGHDGDTRLLLAVPSRQRLERVLKYLFDEEEFLSPYGIRSLSKRHMGDPFVLEMEGSRHEVRYVPGESDSNMFGGNSNWRGPIWFPMNYLIVEVLQRYHYFYGDELRVECPTGSGRWMNLRQASVEICRRLSSLFVPDGSGRRPCHGEEARYASDPHFRDLVLFHEYFHGETGRGLGASHQTGWTALVLHCLEESAKAGV